MPVPYNSSHIWRVRNQERHRLKFLRVAIYVTKTWSNSLRLSCVSDTLLYWPDRPPPTAHRPSVCIIKSTEHEMLSCNSISVFILAKPHCWRKLRHKARLLSAGCDTVCLGTRTMWHRVSRYTHDVTPCVQVHAHDVAITLRNVNRST